MEDSARTKTTSDIEKVVFASSKNIVIAVIINVTVVALIVAGVLHAIEGKWILPIISSVTSVFLIAVFYHNKYIVDGNSLRIVSGFFRSRDYPISKIESVKPSRTLMAAPASGLKRLEVQTIEGVHIIISPKKQEEFISHIKKINPNIKNK